MVTLLSLSSNCVREQQQLGFLSTVWWLKAAASKLNSSIDFKFDVLNILEPIRTTHSIHQHFQKTGQFVKKGDYSKPKKALSLSVCVCWTLYGVIKNEVTLCKLNYAISFDFCGVFNLNSIKLILPHSEAQHHHQLLCSPKQEQSTLLPFKRE